MEEENTRSTVFEDVKTLIEDLISRGEMDKARFPAPLSEVGIDDRMDLASLEMVKFLLAVEERFSLALPDYAYIDVRTYGNLVDAILVVKKEEASRRDALETIKKDLF